MKSIQVHVSLVQQDEAEENQKNRRYKQVWKESNGPKQCRSLHIYTCCVVGALFVWGVPFASQYFSFLPLLTINP